MDRDLLRLALVNHALGAGMTDNHEAWTVVDRVLGEDEGDVRALADRVWTAAKDHEWSQQHQFRDA